MSNLTVPDFQAILPLLILSAAPIVALLAIAFHRCPILTAGISFLGLAGALAALPLAAQVATRQVTPLLIVDNYGLLFAGLIVLAAMAVLLISPRYLAGRSDRPEEYYVLLLLSTLGAAILPMANHFASLFLGLELLSVPLYAMIAYRRDDLGIEAAIKYLVLAGVSSAMLLMGVALLYFQAGSMQFAALPEMLKQGPAGVPAAIALCGAGLVLAGAGFKLALAPFHLWTPDVYQGAPAPVTAFIATASKGAMLALLLRLFRQAGLAESEAAITLLTVLAILSMLAGNLLALLQNNVKRILAYSSIAHLGYLVVALIAGKSGFAAAAFYLVAYMAAALTAFGAISLFSPIARDAQEGDEFRGLWRRRPLLAAVLTISLFALAGLPLTAGFIGKFYILLAGAGSHLWTLAIVLVVSSVVGLFYYLRLAALLYAPPEAEPSPVDEGGPSPLHIVSSRLAGGVLAALAAGILLLGVYPAPLIDFIRSLLGNF